MFPLEIEPKSVTIKDGNLQILWQDSHESIYTEEFLKNFRYAKSDPFDSFEPCNINNIRVEWKDRNPKKFSEILRKYKALVVVNTPKTTPQGTFEIIEEQFKQPIIESHFGVSLINIYINVV